MDPFDEYSETKVIVVTIDQISDVPSQGNYKFSFNGQSISLPTTRWSNTECEIALSAFTNLAGTSCEVTRNGRYGGYTLYLQLAFPVVPAENNVYSHEGDPGLYSFSCDTSSVVTAGVATCTVLDSAATNYPGFYKTVFFPTTLCCLTPSIY
jgi:hypothetical protein